MEYRNLLPLRVIYEDDEIKVHFTVRLTVLPQGFTVMDYFEYERKDE